MYYEATTTLYYNDFQDRQDYLKAYHDLVKHYGFKTRVEGGWKFFEFESDYNTWCNQR